MHGNIGAGPVQARIAPVERLGMAKAMVRVEPWADGGGLPDPDFLRRKTVVPVDPVTKPDQTRRFASHLPMNPRISSSKNPHHPDHRALAIHAVWQNSAIERRRPRRCQSLVPTVAEPSGTSESPACPHCAWILPRQENHRCCPEPSRPKTTIRSLKLRIDFQHHG